MFNSKTVFVLGAGASSEFGLPIGSQLAQKIIQMMDVRVESGRAIGGYDQDLFSAVRTALNCSIGELRAPAVKIRRGLPLRNSIDDFLDLNLTDSRVMLLGKASIVKSILAAEERSALNQRTDHATAAIDFAGLNSNWLLKFVRMLRQSGPEALQEKCAFVSFNYDRSLEYFLYCALQSLYSFKKERAADCVNSLNIVHPYGTVGKLRELGGSLTFGGQHPSAYWAERAGEIKTYSEEAAQLPIPKDIESCFADAQNVIFLGFAFHAQNMKLLAGPEKRAAIKVFATSHGISDEDHHALRRLIASMFNEASVRSGLISQRLALYSGTCDKFFDQYALSLREL